MANNLPRRKFLQQLTGSTAGLLFISPARLLAIPEDNFAKNTDFLSFAYLNGLGPEVSVNDIDGHYVPLHAESILPSYMFDDFNRTYVEFLLRQMMAAQGLKWNESDRIIYSYQYHGYCDHTSECNRLAEYSRTAKDYLYNSVNGLLDIQLNWNVLLEDFDYAKQPSSLFNGLIGRYTYLVNRVNLVDTEGNFREVGLISISPVNRAINYITSEGIRPESSLIYVIPGATSLMSPFSELLHLTTHAPSKRLSDQLTQGKNPHHANTSSHMIGETITESAAYLVARRFLKQSQYGERASVINAHAKSLSNRYSLMGDTVAYMMRHGVQKTLDRFAEDPLHLVKEISHGFVIEQMPKKAIPMASWAAIPGQRLS